MRDAPGGSSSLVNPFVGLRAYEEHEAHLFFGRDGQSDDLAARLARKRFVAVVGMSGCGKSSLVRAGLLPTLHGGFVASAGSGWRIAVMRPGYAPLASLATVLCGALCGTEELTAPVLSPELIESTLRRGSLGLVDAVQQARLPHDENLLVVVDQFEELFRFRQDDGGARADADAAAFVKLLVEAHQHAAAPIYVMLTMRSDYLGECARFRGLPEAMNESQYLVPRMNRDERRQAIEGPVGVGGARISPRLVQGLLNDVGEDPDQLPILQHALMRTWQRWETHRQDGSPLDLDDYEAIGTMTRALSEHADEAYRDLSGDHRRIAERAFKRLSERGPDNREIRRPTPFGELCNMAGAPRRDVLAVIDCFRSPAYSFLMPSISSPIQSDTFVDIAHESLIRKWQRLARWVNEEAESRAAYARLADAAKRHRDGKAGLWRNPELGLARDWFVRERPTAHWAEQYGGEFALADDFLRRSLRRALAIRGAIATVALALVGLTLYSISARQRAEELATRQQQMARVALDAVKKLTYDLPNKLVQIPGALDTVAEVYEENKRILDQVRDIAGQNQATAREFASNSMRMGDLWRQQGDLARARLEYERALPLYQLVAQNDPTNPNWQRDISIYYERIGNVELESNDFSGAASAYRTGLKIVERLVHEDPSNSEWRRALSLLHEKIGDVLLRQGNPESALSEYRIDLDIAMDLADANRQNAGLRKDLATSHERMAAALSAMGRTREAADHTRAAQEIGMSPPRD